MLALRPRSALNDVIWVATEVKAYTLEFLYSIHKQPNGEWYCYAGREV